MSFLVIPNEVFANDARIWVAAVNENFDPNKLKRGAFSATSFLACVSALELEEIVLEEI